MPAPIAMHRNVHQKERGHHSKRLIQENKELSKEPTHTSQVSLVQNGPHADFYIKYE